MSAFTWTWHRLTTPTPQRAAHDTRTYAPHLRGRAFRESRRWAIEVVNTATGERVAYDNGHPNLADAFASAEFATAAARAAWMRGFRRNDLRRGTR